MINPEYIIWSDLTMEAENWWERIQKEHPELTDSEILLHMLEMNSSLFDNARTKLNIQLTQPILIIGDLSSRAGKHMGYKEIASGNIQDCLSNSGEIDSYTWYMDEAGDLRCDAIHRSGIDYYLYRTYRDDVRSTQIDLLKEKICRGTVTRADISRVTRRLGDEIGKVYGWDFPQQGQPIKPKHRDGGDTR